MHVAFFSLLINPRLFKKVEMQEAPEERAAPRTVERTQASALWSDAPGRR
jgi:hypothetical protein